jgi:hypothetical protein
MAIILNDNLQINAGKPIDSRYLTTGNTVYVSTGATNSAIPVPLRYTGLTVNVLGTEYWYKTGVADINLIQKKYDTVLPTGSFVTGATNIGYFSGAMSIQTLTITTLNTLTGTTGYPTYEGNYSSLYNNYYRGIDGKIHVGVPNDNIPKRGYVKTASPVKSWLWNEYTGSSNQVGWILIDGDISQQIGTIQSGVIYYTGSSQVFTDTSWITPHTKGKVIINAVLGSLTTGSTITIGGPVFASKIDNILNFRTLISKTPNIINISSDEAFVYLSGNTGSALVTASNGLTKVGQDVRLGGTLVSGTTIITDSRVTPLGIQYAADYSASFTDRSLIDKGYLNSISAIGGERIFKTISQSAHGFNIGQVVGFSGGTYNKPLADGLYDGEVIGIVTNCFGANSFEVTQAGFVTGITVGGGLITNCTYFLSATAGQCGCLTISEPVNPNYISKSMLIATSVNSGWVLPYAGYVITSGITQGGALIRSVYNISTSPYAVTPSDFYIGAKGGDIVQLVSNVNGQVIVVDDVCGNAAIGNEIQVSGVFFGGSAIACINTAFGSMTFIYNGAKAKWSSIGFSTAAY